MLAENTGVVLVAVQPFEEEVVVVRLRIALADDRSLDRLSNRLTIDRHHDRATNRDVRGHCRRRTERQVLVDRSLGEGQLDLLALVGTYTSDRVGVDRDVHVVDFTVEQRVDLSSLREVLEHDRVEVRLVTPPLRVALQGDRLGDGVDAVEHEWTSRHRRAVRPAGVERGRILGQRCRLQQTEQRLPVRVRLHEGHDDVVGVLTFDDRLDLFVTHLADGLVGRIGTIVRAPHADEVLEADGLAVRPLGEGVHRVRHGLLALDARDLDVRHVVLVELQLTIAIEVDERGQNRSERRAAVERVTTSSVGVELRAQRDLHVPQGATLPDSACWLRVDVVTRPTHIFLVTARRTDRVDEPDW